MVQITMQHVKGAGEIDQQTYDGWYEGSHLVVVDGRELELVVCAHSAEGPSGSYLLRDAETGEELLDSSIVRQNPPYAIDEQVIYDLAHDLWATLGDD